MKPPSRPVALALMVLAPLFWSTAGVLTRYIERANAFEMVFWRSLFAGAFVSAIWLALGRGGPLQAARVGGLTGLFSGAMWAVMFTAFVIALTLASTANVLVTMSVGPLLATLAAWIILKEPVPARTWTAVGVSSSGLAWMFGAGASAEGGTQVAGMLVALLVPVAAAANVVTLRAARARVDLVPAVMIGAAISSGIALPLALPLSATGRDLLLLALMGCFQLGLPCVLYVIASRTLPAPQLALLALLEVVLGPLWSWIGAGEVPSNATLTGGAIVLAALAANELASQRRTATINRE